MKKLLVLSMLILLSSCGGEQISLEKEKVQFQEITIADKKYYFKYPSEAVVDLKELSVYLELSGELCLVNFERNSDFDSKFTAYEKEENRSENITYKSFYKDNNMLSYAGTINDVNFHFFVSDGETLSADCIQFVEDLTESFSDELRYVNERLAFSVKLPADFKVEYLPGETGVVLKKWVEKKIEVANGLPKDPKEVDVFEPYRLEMGVTAMENLENFESLADFVGKNYTGYTIAAKDLEKFSGYLVNETVVLDAISHFFVMNSDESLIYDIYLRVPGKRYLAHEKEFEEFVKGVEF